ncbi:hypothetical protein MMYC01_205308 [Madurella mycetomatis]|uniref:Uncharacterized protein n=1 Tax=Madurella mycetomatis TaxID=100816 RepID=A0A175VXN0_9PEZI|nr:hypothetical protein MMYC01_205308 [Madurella mycetomatis]
MDFILSSLYFKTNRISNKTAVIIAWVAIQSDKCDCNAALIPWISGWCDPNRFPLEDGMELRDIGLGLFAAYLFRSPNFQIVSVHYAKNLPPDFASRWEEDRFLQRLPDPSRFRRAMLKIIDILHNGEQFGPDSHQWLAPCGSSSSKSSSNTQAECHSRTNAYLRALTRLDIWPSLNMFEELPVNHDVEEIEKILDETNHSGNDGICSVLISVKNLIRKVHQNRSSMEGVPLPTLT